MSLDSLIEHVLRREQRTEVVALFAVILLAWAYLFMGAGMDMSALEMTRASTGPASMSLMPAMPAVEWTLHYAVVMFFMWWIMMIAMMLPSAAPMILLFARVSRKQREQGFPHVSSISFTLAYLVTWAGFSAVATASQAALQHVGWLSPMLVGTNAMLGGMLLVAAGLYQATPIKQACLRHCRSPIHFICAHWRPGTAGAVRMGIEHGAYCVGCCWFLMALLFFGGVMNLYWIAGLAVLVLLEKTIPHGHWLSHATGLVLVCWGIAVLAIPAA